MAGSAADAGVGAADHLLHRGREAALDLADQRAALDLRGDGQQQRADGEQQADVLDGALAEAAVTAGLALTNSVQVSSDWTATKLVRPKGTRR